MPKATQARVGEGDSDGTVRAVVIERAKVSPGHVRIRLEWSVGGTAPRLLPGQHLKLYAPNVQGAVAGEWNGKLDSEHRAGERVSRRYTPAACAPDASWYEVIVELITPEMAHPDGGKFSRFAANLKIGDSVLTSGPHGVYKYLGEGQFARTQRVDGDREIVRVANVGLICHGVAVNAVMNLVSAIMAEPAASAPKIWVIMVAGTEDGLVHSMNFQSLMMKNPDRFRLWCVLEREVPLGWPYGSGTLPDALVETRLPPPGGTTLVVSAGGGFVKETCEKYLPAMGFDAGRLWHWDAELDWAAKPSKLDISVDSILEAAKSIERSYKKGNAHP